MFIKVQINVDDRAQKYKGANGSKLAKKKSFLSDYRWTADPNRIFFSQYLILHSTYYLQQKKLLKMFQGISTRVKGRKLALALCPLPTSYMNSETKISMK